MCSKFKIALAALFFVSTLACSNDQGTGFSSSSRASTLPPSDTSIATEVLTDQTGSDTSIFFGNSETPNPVVDAPSETEPLEPPPSPNYTDISGVGAPPPDTTPGDAEISELENTEPVPSPNTEGISGAGQPTPTPTIIPTPVPTIIPTPTPISTTTPSVSPDTVVVAHQALCPHRTGHGRKILVVTFFEFGQWVSDLRLDMNEITQRTGISIEVATKGTFASQYSRILDGEFDGIWIISGQNNDLSNTPANVLQYIINSGMGIFLHAENSPLFADVNHFFSSLGWDLRMVGSYRGEGFLAKDGFPQDRLGKIYEHPINSGLYQSVSEGKTTSFMQGSFIESLLPVLRNTQGGLLAATHESNLENGQNRRIFIHGGYTTLYTDRSNQGYSWTWDSSDSPGTPQFYMNAACWITTKP